MTIKKMALMGVALCATVGFSDGISSKNVVGYQTTTAGDDSVMKLNQLNLMTPTFLGVSSETYRLGDIKLTGCASFGSTIQFLNAYGATAKATADMIGDAAFAAYPDHEALFIYVTDAEGAEYDLPGGWYFQEDWDGDGAYNMNNVLLRKGQGFVLQSLDAGMSVCYSGAVDEGDEGEISLPYNISELNVMGNSTPVNITLGDIVLAGCSSFGSTLQFLNAYGATAIATADMIGEEAAAAFPDHEALFIFITAAEGAEYDLPGGWYFQEDWDGDGAYNMNNVQIKSGQAFVLQALDAGMTVQIPSAIQE